MIFKGFPPVFDKNSKVLILGSFPSVKSRAAEFYYGNKQNRFWKTLYEFLGESANTVEEKKALCLKRGVAIWDIVDSCEIKGSSDSDIKNYKLVDLNEVLDNSDIKKILCNGTKAYELTMSVYNGGVETVKMPSTSPANVRFDKGVWLDELASVLSKSKPKN